LRVITEFLAIAVESVRSTAAVVSGEYATATHAGVGGAGDGVIAIEIACAVAASLGCFRANFSGRGTGIATRLAAQSGITALLAIAEPTVIGTVDVIGGRLAAAGHTNIVGTADAIATLGIDYAVATGLRVLVTEFAAAGARIATGEAAGLRVAILTAIAVETIAWAEGVVGIGRAASAGTKVYGTGDTVIAITIYGTIGAAILVLVTSQTQGRAGVTAAAATGRGITVFRARAEQTIIGALGVVGGELTLTHYTAVVGTGNRVIAIGVCDTLVAAGFGLIAVFVGRARIADRKAISAGIAIFVAITEGAVSRTKGVIGQALAVAILTAIDGAAD